MSDTAALDPSADRSGPTIRQILSDRGVAVANEDVCIIPDDIDAIQRVVRAWTDSQRIGHTIDWIVSTGGTGFGVRDNTPEVGIFD